MQERTQVFLTEFERTLIRYFRACDPDYQENILAITARAAAEGARSRPSNVVSFLMRQLP